MEHIGFVYHTEKTQYDKALGWYLLAARENHPYAQNNIGFLYKSGLGVPRNSLCALKWYLKSIEQKDYTNHVYNIGKLFENGYGIPLDKYKALEWYCHSGDKTDINRLKGEGYHRSATDKSKFNSTID
jgi:TPR repeat protein